LILGEKKKVYNLGDYIKGMGSRMWSSLSMRKWLVTCYCNWSMGPDGIHLGIHRELAEELAKPLSIIYQQSWLSGEVPVDLRLANVTPIYKKGRRVDPGNYRPVSLTLLLLSLMLRHKRLDNPQPRLILHGPFRYLARGHHTSTMPVRCLLMACERRRQM